MASKKSSKWDDSPIEEPKAKPEPKPEPKKQKLTERAKAWVDQAIAKFGDTDITAGVDFLRNDFTAIPDLPPELQGYWGRPGQDMTAHGFQKADPQPDHEMTARGMTLWLTRKDLYDARMERQVQYSQTRMKAAGDEKITGPTPKGMSSEIKGVTKKEEDW